MPNRAKRDAALRALPTRLQRAARWYYEATERGDHMDEHAVASMMAMFAEFEITATTEALTRIRDTGCQAVSSDQRPCGLCSPCVAGAALRGEGESNAG